MNLTFAELQIVGSPLEENISTFAPQPTLVQISGGSSVLGGVKIRFYAIFPLLGFLLVRMLSPMTLTKSGIT